MTHFTPMLLYFLSMFYEIEDIIYVICVYFWTLHFTLSIISAWDFVSLQVFKILISKYHLESHCVLMPNLKYSPSDEYCSQISAIINNTIIKIFVHGDVYKSMIISKTLDQTRTVEWKVHFKILLSTILLPQENFIFLMFLVFNKILPGLHQISLLYSHLVHVFFFFLTTLIFMYCPTFIMIRQLASIIYSPLILVLIPSTNKIIWLMPLTSMGFPHGAVVKNPPANAGNTRDAGSMPG